jgi:chromosome segregation ATPase
MLKTSSRTGTLMSGLIAQNSDNAQKKEIKELKDKLDIVERGKKVLERRLSQAERHLGITLDNMSNLTNILQGKTLREIANEK